ncbi:MAG: glycosyl hydrolase, partial [Candidatus Binatia bacterium]
MTICISHGGTTTYQSKSSASEILVGTVDGVAVLRREQDGAWKVYDKALTGLHIHALLIEPVSGFVFAGAHKGSIHVSKDGGATWEKKDRGLTQKDVYCLS